MFGKTNTSSGSKALHAAQHGNNGTDRIVIDASQVTTGVFDISLIPQAALERCIVVANDAARYALTVESVQVGDTVKVTETGKMWIVKDSANLGTDEGYIEYTASTNWENISNKPESYNPSAHASSHATGGADAITPGSIGAAPASHVEDKNNPHGVTKAQVGLESVEDGAQINVIEGVQIEGVDLAVEDKKVNITKADLELDKVDNTPDKDKPISDATQEALDGKVDDAEIADMVHGLAPIQNVEVPTTAWTKQNPADVEEFTYRAAVSAAGVTADHFVNVVFNQTDASSGNFANVCQSGTDVVYIYAKEQPTETVTLATIIAMKAA